MAYEKCDCKTKEEVSVKIKSSNSIYYSNTLGSIWIPEGQILGLSVEQKIKIDHVLADEDYEPKDLEKRARESEIALEGNQTLCRTT